MERIKLMIKRWAANIIFTKREKKILKSALKYSEYGYKRAGRRDNANDTLFLYEYVEKIF